MSRSIHAKAKDPRDVLRIVIAAVLAVTFLTIGVVLVAKSRGKSPDASDPAPTLPAVDISTTTATTTTTVTTTTATTSTAAATEAEATQAPAQQTTAGTTSAAQNGYFSHSLFIGDSRTEGLRLYGGVKDADFFSKTSMSIYSLPKDQLEVTGMGKKTIAQVLDAKKYQTIYIMLGINEVGSNKTTTVSRYRTFIDEVRQKQPDATVVVCANLHVSKAKSDASEKSGSSITNKNIDALNGMLAELADGDKIRYLDVNPQFDDANGALDASRTGDGVHMKAKYYPQWMAWIAEQKIG